MRVLPYQVAQHDVPPALSGTESIVRRRGNFISIDDNEVSNLRKLCDEIFGEENFVANIIWQKKQSPQNDATYFSDMHDYILVYAKKRSRLKLMKMVGIEIFW